MKTLITAFAMLFAVAANANSINVSYVDTKYDLSSPASTVLDDSATGLSLTYSYDINPMWAIDFGIADLGAAERSIGLIDTKLDVETLSILAHFNMPIATLMMNPVKLHLYGGITRGDAEVTVGAFSRSDQDIGSKYGAGLTYWFNNTWAADLKYTRSSLDFSNTVDFAYNPRLWEFGATYKF